MPAQSRKEDFDLTDYSKATKRERVKEELCYSPRTAPSLPKEKQTKKMKTLTKRERNKTERPILILSQLAIIMSTALYHVD